MSFHASEAPTELGRDRRTTNAVADESSASLAGVLRKQLDEQRMSIYQLSQTSGVDGAYIWRILRGERENVSREVVIRLGVALVLEWAEAERVIDTTNELLNAAGFKRLS